MSTDSQSVVAWSGKALPDPRASAGRDGGRADAFERQVQERNAAVQQILAQQKPELIQQGVEAYKRDLPRLLADNRYLQQVAYRGNELVAIAATWRQLSRKLRQKGLEAIGELFTITVAPLEPDEEDEPPHDVASFNVARP
jgi:hypothetical protein